MMVYSSLKKKEKKVIYLFFIHHSNKSLKSKNFFIVFERLHLKRF